MEWWQTTYMRIVAMAVILAGVGAIGAIRAASLAISVHAPKFLCIQCNRYYRDIKEHLCYHRRD